MCLLIHHVFSFLIKLPSISTSSFDKTNRKIWKYKIKTDIYMLRINEVDEWKTNLNLSYINSVYMHRDIQRALIANVHQLLLQKEKHEHKRDGKTKRAQKKKKKQKQESMDECKME